MHDRSRERQIEIRDDHSGTDPDISAWLCSCSCRGCGDGQCCLPFLFRGDGTGNGNSNSDGKTKPETSSLLVHYRPSHHGVAHKTTRRRPVVDKRGGCFLVPASSTSYCGYNKQGHLSPVPRGDEDEVH
mmetsp:Transcript_46557/g.47278  ORF Transcript_46557/g.47278 Transcript_46557/m.47278 type:complete len:129 (-) Transcript_46557:1219-1605(-)